MKKTLLLILPFFMVVHSFGQTGKYWQQTVNYSIIVSLNDTAKSLDGFEHIQYYNNSPDTLHFIWFHVWPNAYKNDRTAFTEQELENGNADFYFSDEEKRGYINRLDFKVNKHTALTEDHPQYQDIIKLYLPSPLLPGTSAEIETPFHVKLPYNFSRGGYIGQSFQITQWYPKPAVYDKKGWHEMPYLDQGEFYSEFGEYNVTVTVPKNYVVASTGLLKNESGNGDTKTLEYNQKDIHDFAWFADKDFVVLHDTLMLSSHVIVVNACYNKANSERWKNSIGYIKDAIKTKCAWLGEYPYDVVTVVERPGKDDVGGMEYPTICLISVPPDDQKFDELINHEVGHNWLYGVLANNERTHPWMDEGMNSYYDKRYSSQKYCNVSPAASKRKESFISKRIPDNIPDLLLRSVIAVKKDQCIETASEDFTEVNYNAVAYYKMAEWMSLLQEKLGKRLFDSVMHEYFFQWKFRHPYPEDFKSVAEEVSGEKLDSIFTLLNKKGDIGFHYSSNCSLDGTTVSANKKIKVYPFFNFKKTDKYNYVFVSPAIGYNFYDKLMVGGLLHNYTLPATRLRFLLAPLYATGSKKLNGTGRVSYSLYGNKGQQAEIALSAATFTADQFIDSSGKKNYQPFTKIVPSFKYVFANRYARSTITKFIQWKTFLITETGLAFTRDTVQQADIISYPKEKRYVNQLQFIVENNRKLYPYRVALTGEQGKDFIRLNLTANYFFNYAKSGGLDVRLFAGKFIYTTDKTFASDYETDRYHLNMSGPKGYEDYTYSNYFVGRNEFDGFSNRQIMNRDGAFKVKSDLLSDKIGKTDDWLGAVNFTTSIPKKINPLELLPVKIPIKLFFDLGTYAEAGKATAGAGRFLYDAGVQASLFKNVLNIYFPFLYSKVYRDYFKSTIGQKIFKQNITFSIDIQNISARKLIPQIPF